jgi:hypothetical protein
MIGVVYLGAQRTRLQQPLLVDDVSALLLQTRCPRYSKGYQLNRPIPLGKKSKWADGKLLYINTFRKAYT